MPYFAYSRGMAQQIVNFYMHNILHKKVFMCFYPVQYLNVPRQPTHQDLRMLPLQHPLISVRPVPDIPVFRFRLCKFPPPQLYCRYGNRCTNAHSEEELQVWNKEKDRRDRGKSCNA